MRKYIVPAVLSLVALGFIIFSQMKSEEASKAILDCTKAANVEMSRSGMLIQQQVNQIKALETKLISTQNELDECQN